jgi:hypothetical protein
LQSTISTVAPSAPRLSMKAIWRTIRGYILWSYERGTLHYDIMVTLILLFVFLSPRVINFKDKPIARNAHPTGVLVMPDGQGGLLYQIDGTAVSTGDDRSLREQFLHIVEPISGEVAVIRYEAVADGKGRVQSYKVWVKRE